MRKTLRASVLILAFCGSAYAGDMSNPATPQPPPTAMTAAENTTDGEIEIGLPDSFAETLLSVLDGVLALR